MCNDERVGTRLVLVLAAFLCWPVIACAATPAPLVEKRGDIEARATLDQFDIRLSGETKLTLSVEGPGPLTVTPSKPLLAKANLWRVREDGLPLREVNGGREKWSQVYRLSPLVPGKPEVAPGPLIVRAGGMRDIVIDWSNQSSLVVQVRTTVDSPSPEALRPATDIEQLPPSVTVRDSSGWLFAIVPGLLVLSAIGIFLGRRSARFLLHTTQPGAT